jgi:hypothetical protein
MDHRIPEWSPSACEAGRTFCGTGEIPGRSMFPACRHDQALIVSVDDINPPTAEPHA